MGFWNKLKRWILGKGFQEEEIQPIQPIETIEQPIIYKTEQETIEPQKEQIISTEKPKSIKETTITPMPESRQQFETAIKKIRSKPKISTIQQKIRPTGTNTVTFEPQDTNINSLRPIYTKLFTDNAKLNDPDILEVLFQGRNQLQHRFSTTIDVWVDGKYANSLLIVGTLVEHSSIINEKIWLGLQIDSPPQLDSLLKELGTLFMERFGAINFSLSSTNMFKGKITNIIPTTTFA